jgi:hypothetical protein
MWGAFFSADTHSPMTPQTFISREHCIAAIDPQGVGQHTLPTVPGQSNVKERKATQHEPTCLDLHGRVESHLELVAVVLGKHALVALLEQRARERVPKEQMPACTWAMAPLARPSCIKTGRAHHGVPLTMFSVCGMRARLRPSDQPRQGSVPRMQAGWDMRMHVPV